MVTRNELLKMKNALDAHMESHLIGMKPCYDDSITGFNEAWDVIRKFFDRLVELYPEKEG